MTKSFISVTGQKEIARALARFGDQAPDVLADAFKDGIAIMHREVKAATPVGTSLHVTSPRQAQELDPAVAQPTDL